jgi:hypothetical protein
LVEAKVSSKKQIGELAISVSTVVEHTPHHPKIGGLSPAAATGKERERRWLKRICKKILIV